MPDPETAGQRVAREWEWPYIFSGKPCDCPACEACTRRNIARIDAAVAALVMAKAEAEALVISHEGYIERAVAEARREERAVCLAIAQAAADAMRDHEGCPLSAGEPCGDCGYVDGCDDVAAAIRARGKS